MRVLVARGTELERGFPFALVRQAFEPALVALEPAEREQLLAGAARPAVRSSVWEPARRRLTRRPIVCDPQRALLADLELAEAQPTLLALDDAHWSDSPSLRFCAFSFPVSRTCPWCSRSRPPGGGRRGAPARARRRPAGERDPAPRAQQGRGHPVGARGAFADEEFCSACHETSAGNPFMLRELLVELAADASAGTAAEAAQVREVAPATIQRAVLAVRLARLADSASSWRVRSRSWATMSRSPMPPSSRNWSPTPLPRPPMRSRPPA